MPRYAVIDVGTNSVKFNISERRDDGSWRTLVDRAEVTRLGEGLEKTGAISSDAMERTIDAIAGMAAEAKERRVTAIAAVGTMGMRTARNSQQFIDAVEQRCGIRIEIIPGEEEGRLAYLAVKSGLGLGDGSLAVFDTGGGSTQFTFGCGSVVAERFSLNVGAVRFTEDYHLDGIVSPEQLQAALDAIAKDLSRLDREVFARGARRHGWRNHKYRRSETPAREVRSRRHSRIDTRVCRDRSPDRTLPYEIAGRPPFNRWAPTEAG